MTDDLVHGDFHDAYLANLRNVTGSYSFDVAPRGQASLEKLGISITIQDPVQRVCMVPARRTNIVFNFAEALWYLSGSNRTEEIAYYAPSVRKYSMDGRILTGTAYGVRLFGVLPSVGASQWDRVVDVLKQDDPSSKRAVISIYDACEDITQHNIDVSCTICLQFLLRMGRLHLVVFMRANDAYRGIVSDVFSFTLLQEVMARQLGVQIGQYHHMVGSMHVYKTDLAQTAQVLVDAERDRSRRPEFPAMPDGDNWPYIRRVLELERTIREAGAIVDLPRCRRELPAYWYQVVVLLMLFRRAVKDAAPAIDVLEQLSPIYRRLVEVRWPHVTAR